MNTPDPKLGLGEIVARAGRSDQEGLIPVLRNAALDAAVLLLGAERGRALIGCDWGTKVSLPNDQEVCTSQASRRLILHGPTGDEYELKACNPHAEVVERETDPHEADQLSSDNRPNPSGGDVQ